MMHRHSAFALVLACSLISCQKVKDLAGKAKDAATSATAPKAVGPLEAAAPGGEIDKALEPLVDRTEEGVRFRKDLPFPQRLKVTATNTTEYQNVRVSSTSAFGPGSGSFSGITERVIFYEKEGSRIAFRSESTSRAPAAAGESAPAADAAKTSADGAPAEGAVAPEKAVMKAAFQLKDGRWVAEREEDFLLAAKIREMQPGFAAKAAEDGLIAREMWFGKTRWKEGSKLTLVDKEIGMLFAGSLLGRLELVFESVEAVGGHPCGRFSIKGKCSGKVPGSAGSEDDAHMDMSITDGRIWLSLIHPLVMRGEYEMITSTSGKQNGIKARAQGGMTLKQSLIWKPGA